MESGMVLNPVYFIGRGEVTMEIERINENTVKFFMSYVDIEERGFTREEVWYNREKSEELFWDMMDEINEEAEFEIEGPLWIQVHAMNNGIEVTVTRAQGNSEQMDQSPFNQHKEPIGMAGFGDSDFASISEMVKNETADEVNIEEGMFEFKEFEDIISIASKMSPYYAQTKLFAYDNKYYLHVLYDEELMDEESIENMYHVLLEFGKSAMITTHVLEEYGKIVMNHDVFQQVTNYFS